MFCGVRVFRLSALFLFAIAALSLSAQPVEPGRTTAEGYAVPREGYVFAFPRDHGSNPDFALEWWYLVGHLKTVQGRPFAYQATFFRQAAPPRETPPEAAYGPFASDQLYLAHMALFDLEAGEHLHEERLNRAGWNASAARAKLDLVNGNWTLRMEESSETMRLRGSVHAEASFELTLQPVKEKVLFGENGLSRKGEADDARSYYITFTRLATTGKLTLGGESFTVEGLSWMDHEISSGQLADGQVGWDWTCMQLDDGRDLMAFILRREDGTADPYSSLTWVGADGTKTAFGPDRFVFEPQRWWTSGETGARYPVEQVVVTTDPATGEERRLRLVPLLDTAELGGDIAYWEGACRVVDEATGEIIGQAFLEMTGYAESIGGRL